ncbi:MAG TPA: DUF488 family protein [Dehalococcoidia bacterium]|nr:DUF488 family protein [Dehalococcoidia bacterium]
MAARQEIRIKRVYEPPAPEDGRRVLVDRLWPRGLSKERARLDAWLRELAPSDELRRWFGHDPGRWQEFSRRYRRELADPVRQAALKELAAGDLPLTLLYAARDTEHNEAQILKQVLDERRRNPAR